MADVVEVAGAAGVVEVDCPVCGSARRRLLFHKQGFPFQRCTECTHVYPSPRVAPHVQEAMLVELDDLACEDKYLEVQRQYAELICDLLRRRTPGARLLDIGFGRGYLLQMAQVYGFEVFGVDSSAAHVERLRPHYGQRVAQCVVGRDTIPWEAMDVVVMSHVLEHLQEPDSALADVRKRMNPGGLLYVAVPDIDATEFKVFGKTWDVINPLVHLHYFSEQSLDRQLLSVGFEAVERVRHPLPADEISPRWARLMRHLGGDEVGELTVIARVPGAQP
jgi:SAM-dependent methyltransferase